MEPLFTWPDVEDIAEVADESLVSILPAPEITRRGSFKFAVSFSNYSLE